MNKLLMLIQLLVIPISAYFWLAFALLTKRARAKTYTFEFWEMDETYYESSPVIVDDFNMVEKITSISLTFNGYASEDKNSFYMPLYFDSAETDNNDPFCYLVWGGLGSDATAGNIGYESAPVTLSTKGTVTAASGTAPFTTSVY